MDSNELKWNIKNKIEKRQRKTLANDSEKKKEETIRTANDVWNDEYSRNHEKNSYLETYRIQKGKAIRKPLNMNTQLKMHGRKRGEGASER